MFVITEKTTCQVITIGMLKEYWDNGYPIIVDQNNFECAYPTNSFDMHEVNIIPENVVPEKYCYTEEKGFYENPNWIEPNNNYGIPYDKYEEISNKIIDDYTLELMESGLL